MATNLREKLLQSLSTKVEQALAKHRDLLQDNERLKIENNKLRLELEEVEKKLKIKQNMLEANKIVGLFDDVHNDKAGLVDKIDNFLRAIDDCINLLEKQS